MDSGATKHTASHRTGFDIYQLITLHNVYLDDKSIMKAFKSSSIIIEVMVKKT